MKAFATNLLARNKFRDQKQELLDRGFEQTSSVMSDQPGSPANGVWFAKRSEGLRARIAGGEVTVASAEYFEQERDAYIALRAIARNAQLVGA